MKNKIVLMTVFITAVSFVSQAASAQKSNPATAKAKLVDQLLELTITSYPAKEMQNSFRANIDKLSESDIKENGDTIQTVLEKNQMFSADEKIFLMNNLSQLAMDLGKQINGAVINDLNFEEWARKSLRVNYSKSFTVAELNRMIEYFRTDHGKLMLDSININLRDIFDSDKDGSDVVSYPETAPFVVSSTGKKFIDIVYNKVVKDISGKAVPSEAVQPESVAKVLIITGEENINKLMSDFLQASYTN